MRKNRQNQILHFIKQLAYSLQKYQSEKGAGEQRNYSELKETKRHNDWTGEKIIRDKIIKITDETIDYGLNSILSTLNSWLYKKM